LQNWFGLLPPDIATILGLLLAKGTPVVGGATVTTGSLLLIDIPIVPWSESLDKALELDKYTYVTLLASLSSTVLGVLVLTSVD